MVEVSWAEAVESLELGYELQRQPSETRTEYAGRLQGDRRIPAEEFQALAERATVARFHPDGVTELQAQEATNMANRIDASVRARVPIYVRLRRQLDPRRLLQSGSRVTIESGRPTTRSGADAVIDDADLAALTDDELDVTS
ncbi:MAG: DUF4129 domain-containing protein [Actinomycetota bacterium]